MVVLAVHTFRNFWTRRQVLHVLSPTHTWLGISCFSTACLVLKYILFVTPGWIHSFSGVSGWPERRSAFHISILYKERWEPHSWITQALMKNSQSWSRKWHKIPECLQKQLWGDQWLEHMLPTCVFGVLCLAWWSVGEGKSKATISTLILSSVNLGSVAAWSLESYFYFTSLSLIYCNYKCDVILGCKRVVVRFKKDCCI